MLRVTIVVLQLAIVGSAAAQVLGSSRSGLGVTSPFGMSPASPVSPSGIPLGATELSTPGLSPAPTASCLPGSGLSTSSGYSGSGVAGLPSGALGSVFPGSVAAACAATGNANAVGSAGLSPPLSASSGNAVSGNIPLGATELNSAGLSQPIPLPAPIPSIPSQPTFGTTSPFGPIGPVPFGTGTVGSYPPNGPLPGSLPTPAGSAGLPCPGLPLPSPSSSC